MGCPCSKTEDKKEEETPKVYSWDRKDRPDPKDYKIEDLNGETVGRVPGKVDGQQFIIKNCQNCNIYIFDHSATITIDKCQDCNIFLGPIKGSIFLRNCTNCKAVIACQQFRTRDCKSIDVFLHCSSQPIIETSTKIRFGCFQYHYPELADQFAKSNLSPYCNTWDTIHDFSPMPDEQNWSQLPESAEVSDYLPLPTTEQFQSMTISTSADDSVVPLTLGGKKHKGSKSSLVAFFKDPSSDQRLRKFINEMRNEGSCSLVRTTEVNMDAGMVTRLFGEDNRYISAATNGPVVGLEFAGANTAQKCQEVAQPLIGDSIVYLPQSPEEGTQALDGWKNLVETQMAM
ncbi:protein XRP2-like isoform X1 [Asterias rubens]|uniref:protein XRP2-like isoform X1 n=1 Tax=Asterias rubens TaxID=7604 RepID=UPI001455BFE2|nr:protein XRP2-like isoform X1 [Asterias rubens]